MYCTLFWNTQIIYKIFPIIIFWTVNKSQLIKLKYNFLQLSAQLIFPDYLLLIPKIYYYYNIALAKSYRDRSIILKFFPETYKPTSSKDPRRLRSLERIDKFSPLSDWYPDGSILFIPSKTLNRTRVYVLSCSCTLLGMIDLAQNKQDNRILLYKESILRLFKDFKNLSIC